MSNSSRFTVWGLVTSCLLIHIHTPQTPAQDIASPSGGPAHANWHHQRAGNPLTIAPWARWTYGPDYRGYFVGGSTPRTRMRIFPPADWRFPTEGTWGMDYAPDWSHVDLLWTHGRRYQGGQGQYEPDRPNRPFGRK